MMLLMVEIGRKTNSCVIIEYLYSCLNFGTTEEKVIETLQRVQKLLDSFQRVAPGLDDKILVSWNSLMVTAFAKGYRNK